jgi:phosphoribosylanthranilate isomerase
MVIKICGLRTVEQARAAATAGADLIGLVFAPSRRRISPVEGAAITAALRAANGSSPLIVGLFVNEPPATIRAVAREVGLDLVQLSGDEPASYAAALEWPVLKAIRMDGSPNEAAWLELAGATTMDPQQRPRLLIDAHVPGAYGGTGVVADWVRAAALAARLPIVLAGGLNPANVAAAIAEVRPWGVDVSSGVERDGAKDPRQIEAFIAAARAA